MAFPTSNCPSAAGPGVPPLPLLQQLSRTVDAAGLSGGSGLLRQESRDVLWNSPGSGCAKGGDLLAPAAASRARRGLRASPAVLGVWGERPLQ